MQALKECQEHTDIVRLLPAVPSSPLIFHGPINLRQRGDFEQAISSETRPALKNFQCSLILFGARHDKHICQMSARPLLLE